MVHCVSHAGKFISHPTAAQNAAHHDPVSAALASYDKLRKKGTQLVRETVEEIGSSVVSVYQIQFLSKYSSVLSLRDHTYVCGPLSPGLQFII
jgi:hypothetical protein